MIKAAFSRAIPKTERITTARQHKRECGVWQRRYWEHQIRDEVVLVRHVDYIHINPVKNGHVSRMMDWPYSIFHRYVKSGLLVSDWAGETNENGSYGERS